MFQPKTERKARDGKGMLYCLQTLLSCALIVMEY